MPIETTSPLPHCYPLPAERLQIKTLVRSRFLYAKSLLEDLGVSAICFEEEEVARAMTEALAMEVHKDKT